MGTNSMDKKKEKEEKRVSLENIATRILYEKRMLNTPREREAGCVYRERKKGKAL